MATNKPSSNKPDKARMRPNAASGRDSMARSGTKAGARHESAGRGSGSGMRGGGSQSSRSSASSLHDIDEAGTGLSDQDAGTSMHGSQGSGVRGQGSSASGHGAGTRSHGDSSRVGGEGSASGTRGERIVDVMTRNVCLANPDQTIREAAAMMADADVGSLPVGENDRLVGMITDRDIVLRAVAEGRDTNTTVREVMTDRIQYCFEDENVDEVARNMADLGVRRLPVVNRDKRLVGIVALSNITHCHDSAAKERFLDSVAAPH